MKKVAASTRSVYLFELMVLKDNNSKKIKKKPIMQDFVHFTCCKDLNEMDIWVRNSIRMIMSIDANINGQEQFEMFIVQLQTNNNKTRIVFPFLMLLRIAKLAAPVVENCFWFRKKKSENKIQIVEFAVNLNFMSVDYIQLLTHEP